MKFKLNAYQRTQIEIFFLKTLLYIIYTGIALMCLQVLLYVIEDLS